MAVLAGHFIYVTPKASAGGGKGPWASYDFEQSEQPSRLSRYIGAGEYWLGFSYGLAGAFAAFSLARILRMRRESVAVSAGGLTIGAVLWTGLCFLVGCCGSPMLPIYLGLFGPGFFDITKPLTFGITLISVVMGYTWMLKRARKAKRC